MTRSFQSCRTSLAPIAGALAAATSEYVKLRQEAEDAHLRLTSARLLGAPNLNEVSMKSDAAVEALGASQEKIAKLMAELQAQGGLTDFYAFASTLNRNAN